MFCHTKTDDIIVTDPTSKYSIHFGCLEEAGLCDIIEAEDIFEKLYGKKFWC